VSQLGDTEMVQIMLQFLEKMGMDRVEVSGLRSLKGSKFRQASKIEEQCQVRYGIRFEAETLLNPTVNECRKLLVNCLSKLSASIEDVKVGSELSFEERVKKERLIR
jgi:hypothetical protein